MTFTEAINTAYPKGFLIYKITNPLTSCCYVGCTQSPANRFRIHRSRFNRDNKKRRIGSHVFFTCPQNEVVVEILEYLGEIDKKIALKKEREYILAEGVTHNKMHKPKAAYILQPPPRSLKEINNNLFEENKSLRRQIDRLTLKELKTA